MKKMKKKKAAARYIKTSELAIPLVKPDEYHVSQTPSPSAESLSSIEMSSVMEDDKKRGVVFDAPVSAKTEVGQETSLEHVMYSDFASRSVQWKQEQEALLLKKIDWRLMPLLTLIYLLNYLDRANLAQARQGSLEKDLGMTGSDYNLATSIFFVGYLFMQLPSNLLITKVRPSIYLATVVCLWGVVSTCNAAAKNFTHLILVRFFLGK